MRKSPLHSQHESLNASFKEENGWLLPEYFSSPEKEWEAVRTSMGILDLNHVGKILIQGQDRASFLHNMVSNDIKSLLPGNYRYATLLTPKGKMISDLHIYALENHLLIALNENLVQPVIDKLSAFIISEDVQIQDATTSYGLLSLQGPQSTSFAQTINFDSFKTKIFPHSRTGEEGYDVWIPTENLIPLWKHLKTGEKTTPIGMQAYQILRIEAGIPLFGVDMNQNTIPNEANLENAISWNKGCYPGQEIVARIKYLGGVRKLLSGFILERERVPNPQSKIFRGNKEIGYITSSTHSLALKKPIALGIIKKTDTDDGTQIEIEDGNEKRIGEITTLPFYKKL